MLIWPGITQIIVNWPNLYPVLSSSFASSGFSDDDCLFGKVCCLLALEHPLGKGYHATSSHIS